MSGINISGRTIHLPAKTANGINISNGLGQLSTGAVETMPSDRDLIAAIYAADFINRGGCATVDQVRPEALNLVDVINDLVNPEVKATMGGCGPCATTVAKPNAVAVLYGAMLDYYQRAAANLPEIAAETDDTATTLAAIQASLVSIENRLSLLESGSGS